MLPTPGKFKIVAGFAEGNHRLTAFDSALLEAGIGNVNLLRVSSILPPAARQDQKMELPPGALVPAAYAQISCDEPDTLIAACVGVGLSTDTFGLIMEYSGYNSQNEAEQFVEAMLHEAFRKRGMDLQKTIIKGIEHRVKIIGAAVAAVVLWN